ncbi:hypothetical protein Tco_0736195 [Tanacetum coccineum]
MRADELYKFSEETLKTVRDAEKKVHSESRAIGWCSGTRDGLQTDDCQNWRNLPRDIPLDRIEVLSMEDSHHKPSDAMHNPPQPVGKTLVSKLTEITHVSIDFLTPRLLILKRWQLAPTSDY